MYLTHQQMTRASRRRYLVEFKDALAQCLRIDAGPPAADAREAREEGVRPLRRHIRRWFARGAPIDPQGAGAPAETLRIVIRQVALQFPGLAEYHADCRLWLANPEVRGRTDAERERLRRDLARFTSVKPYAEAWIPWNLALHAPRGTPYETFNRVGFEVTTGAPTRFPEERTA